MYRKALGLVVLATLTLSPDKALAEQPYYFHKADVSREAYAADVERCAQLAGGARTASYQARPTNYNAPYAVEAAAIANLFIGFMERAERRRVQGRVERTCMADKGYQRREIEKPVNREIRELEGGARLDRLFALVSATQPSGKALVE